MANLNAIQGRYRGFALSPHLFDSFGVDAVSYTHLTLPTNREV